MAKGSSAGLLESLVAIDTTSQRSNLEAIELLRRRLDAIGATCEVIASDDGGKANLLATIGPSDRPGIMLSGHTDCVPVAGQAWTTDPFRLARDGSRLRARGTADMKGFIAVAVTAAEQLDASRLKRPLQLCFSYDEEVGCLGVRKVLERLRETPGRTAMCIIGEPTGMRVATGHKGKMAMRVRVRGLEGHSSRVTHGVNAVEYAAELVAYVRRLAQSKAACGPHDAAYDPSHTTLHTGLLQGGTALNIIPASAALEFEIRHIAGDDPQVLFDAVVAYARNELEPQMQRVASRAGFEFEVMASYPALDTPPDSDIVALAKSLAQSNDDIRLSFGTEGGLFSSHAGIPTIVCGPGEIAQAHQPDEFIEIEQIERCEAFMDRLFQQMTA